MPSAKIYAAMNRASAMVPLRPLAGTRKAAQQYVDKITRSRWWQDNAAGYDDYDDPPPQRIWVREDPEDTGGVTYSSDYHDHRGNPIPYMILGHGEVNDGKIAIADQWVILHELAHIMNAQVEDRGHHGKEFVYTLAALIDRWLGHEAARALKQAAKDLGMKLNYSLLPE